MTYEVVLDNSRMLANCFEETPCVPMILDAVGGFNNLGEFNAPTITGSNVLEDSSDATYATWPEGSGNATIALEIPTQEVTGPLYLHLRMRVLTADPVGFVGTGEVFINTLANGSSATEIASFTDGAVSGFGFNLPAGVADGIVEVVKGLNLSAWPSTTFAEVVAALEAGAYLDFNAWSWVSGDEPPTFRVYKAWVEQPCP